MLFERLVEGLNGRKFPLLARHPDVLMKVCVAVLLLYDELVLIIIHYAGAHHLL
jgi:hypothetical protein